MTFKFDDDQYRSACRKKYAETLGFNGVADVAPVKRFLAGDPRVAVQEDRAYPGGAFVTDLSGTQRPVLDTEMHELLGIR